MTEEKKPESKAPENKAENKKPEVKPEPTKNRRKTCCWLALGGVVFLILISPAIRGIFFVKGSVIPTPPLQTTAAPTAGPTAKPTAKPTARPTAENTGEGYPAPAACEKAKIINAVPYDTTPNDPGVHQAVKSYYYQVYGYTPTQVRASLNQCNNMTDEGQFDAYTSWYVNWHWFNNQTGGRCNARQLAVGVSILYYYPKWDDPGNAEAGLAERWRNYINNLTIHEEGHGQSAIDAGNAVYDTIANLAPQATCDQFEALANQAADNVITEYNARDIQYDASTNHGATQGALFP